MFVRGFKTWCENVAAQHRRELDLRAHDPLPATQLAAHLDVAVKSPEEIPGVDPDTLRVLLEEDPGSWSAITLFVDGKDLIILNSAHRGGRPSSDLMHELAHLLLGHKPGQTFISADGMMILSAFDKTQEDEANWLAGTLLLPRAALLSVRRRRLSEAQVLRTYDVSKDMLRYRLNVTGVDRQVRRYSARSRTR